MLKFFLTVGSLTGLNRLMGILREILTSYFLGASVVSEAIIVSIKIPSFFRRILAEGALNAAMVPVFNQENQHSQDRAETFLSSIFMMWLFILGGLLFFFELFTPSIIQLLVPGLSKDPERLALTVHFSRIVFPFVLFISLAAVICGALNSLEKFFVITAAPILLNLFCIGVLGARYFLSYDIGEAFTTTVLASGVAQFLWVYWALHREGLRIRFLKPVITPPVKRFFVLLLPGFIAISITQLNVIVDLMFASYLPRGSIAFIHFAEHLNHMPLSILSVSIGTALLPILSRDVENKEQLFKDQNLAIKLISRFVFPLAASICVMSDVIVKIVYGHGEFDANSVSQTASVLSMFSLGLPAIVLSRIGASTYFAHQNTTTPLFVGLSGVALNCILNFSLLSKHQHTGIAFATAFSSWFVFIIYIVSLLKSKLILISSDVLQELFKTITATVFLAIAAYLLKPTIINLMGKSFFLEIFYLCLLITTGSGFYMLTRKLIVCFLQRITKLSPGAAAENH